MPMHRILPDFVEKNHKMSTFVKEKNLLSTKGVVKEGKRFYANADKKLIKKVPAAKDLVNRTISLEYQVKTV